jgi:hypothetical protein
MAKLPAKKKPKNMTEGKTGEAAKTQKPIRIPTVKKDAPSKPAPQIVTKPSPSIAKAGITPKGMTQGKLDPKRVIKEPRTKDDTAAAPKRVIKEPRTKDDTAARVIKEPRTKDDKATAPKRVIKEPRTKDDKATATATASKGKKLSRFGAAFAAARKSGKKEFTYRGKKYNTKVK